jgi:hypothetical protein
VNTDKWNAEAFDACDRIESFTLPADSPPG